MSKRPSFPQAPAGGKTMPHTRTGERGTGRNEETEEMWYWNRCACPLCLFACPPLPVRSSSSPRLASFCPAVLPPGRLSGRGVPATNPFVAGPGPATPSHSKALGRKSVAKVEGGGKLKPEGLRKIKRGVGRRRPRSRNFKKIRQLRAVTVSGVRSRGFLV